MRSDSQEFQLLKEPYYYGKPLHKNPQLCVCQGKLVRVLKWICEGERWGKEGEASSVNVPVASKIIVMLWKFQVFWQFYSEKLFSEGDIFLALSSSIVSNTPAPSDPARQFTSLTPGCLWICELGQEVFVNSTLVLPLTKGMPIVRRAMRMQCKAG